MRIAVVGSGFAGAILSRILHRQGHEVLLLERAAHPRFALGESSTPLAAICLERLAARYGLDDLHHLAAYGRWLAHMPAVRRGLKRGFTFYRHRPGRPYQNDERNANRLLVAASPSDGAADTHWLRADVDHFLVERAEAEGVDYRDRCEVRSVETAGTGFRIAGVHGGRSFAATADVVIDASGAGGVLARHLDIPSHLERVGLDTGLVFGHFADVRSFPELARAAGADMPEGPYPDERAAVHHLIDEGWLYMLPFDDGVVSAGFVLETAGARRMLREGPPESAWRRLLDRYPTLRTQFAGARALHGIQTVPRLQRRFSCAAGENWALLPHGFSFLSPLFSTGIAWSLLGVERLALVFETATGDGASTDGVAAGLMRYGALLDAESQFLDRLVTAAYRVRVDFDLFCAFTYLYFAAVSYAEAAQRLLPQPPAGGAWAWEGFAGSGDPVVVRALHEAVRLLGPDAMSRSAGHAQAYLAAVRRLIEPRNVAGLADAGKRRLYPVDFDALVAGAHHLGLDAQQVTAQIPRLRGMD